MKEILHICSDIYSKTNFHGLTTRTEGVVHNHVLLLGESRNTVAGDGAMLYEMEEEHPFNTRHFAKLEGDILQFLGERVNPETISLVHAHALFGSGAIAYQLYQRYRTPYIVEIRNEDVRNIGNNPFWFKKHGIEILQCASRVVFLNRNYQDFLASRLSSSTADHIFSQSLNIHDGIDNYWLSNLYQPKPVSLINIRLLYAGADLDAKYLRSTLKAMDILRKKNFQVHLTILGNELKAGQLSSLSRQDDRIQHLTFSTKEELLEQFRRHDIFILPETAGSSAHYYAESLTQGIPVIYNHHEGLDGIFPDGDAGYAVHANAADDMADKILLISERYATIEQHLTDLHPLNIFNWDDIYRQYLRIYELTGR